MNNTNLYLPHEVKVVERIQESPTVFTLRVQFTDFQLQKEFVFQPGQFNMLYLYGVGEVAISIVSDPENSQLYDHTIRAIGRVTRGLEQLQRGDYLGIRGPFGRGWPLALAQNKDVVIITGGLGCAPVVSVINYIALRRDQYGKLIILQGLKHSDDFIFRHRYGEWQKMFDTEVFIAADVSVPGWPWYTGHITDMTRQLSLNENNTIVMMCGPEIMMKVAIKELLAKNIPEENIFLSMERNMECGVGHCGHCQYGGLFVCKDGPIFQYPEIKALLMEPGF
ncbi:MAG: FAD/NAD(P)-binding protein [Gammaproteobacteria bacterium]|nr:FAD/NAD(P)-binding protein [Gammaproteobacteria bacterium]